MLKYIYSQGDLLENVNTYFYTEFIGHQFIEAWRNARIEALESLPDTQNDIQSCQTEILSLNSFFSIGSDEKINTEVLLNSVLASLKTSSSENNPELKRLLSFLVHRFEVFKKIHVNYNHQYRACDKSDFKVLHFYILTAEIFNKAYKETKKIQFLNVFLKIMDTLCASREKLELSDKEKLSRLIKDEMNLISELEDMLGDIH